MHSIMFNYLIWYLSKKKKLFNLVDKWNLKIQTLENTNLTLSSPISSFQSMVRIKMHSSETCYFPIQ